MENGKFDHKKFTFKEIFINEDGKTSCSGFIGGMAGLAAILGFVVSLIGWFAQLDNLELISNNSLQFLGISALLLGVRKGASAVIKKKILE